MKQKYINVFNHDDGYFEHQDAVIAFAGTDFTKAVIYPEENLLTHFDDRFEHYELIDYDGTITKLQRREKITEYIFDSYTMSQEIIRWNAFM